MQNQGTVSGFFVPLPLLFSSLCPSWSCQGTQHTAECNGWAENYHWWLPFSFRGVGVTTQGLTRQPLAELGDD